MYLADRRASVGLVGLHGRAQFSAKFGECTAVHNDRAKRVLFTWELRDKARRKRWFYVNLKRALDGLPPTSWNKVGGSVYLVDEKYSHEFRELLKHFGGPKLKWCEFRVESSPATFLEHCTAVHTICDASSHSRS